MQYIHQTYIYFLRFVTVPVTIPAAACVTKTLDYDNRDEVKFVLMGSQAVSDVKVGSLGCGYVYSLGPHGIVNPPKKPCT